EAARRVGGARRRAARPCGRPLPVCARADVRGDGRRAVQVARRRDGRRAREGAGGGGEEVSPWLSVGVPRGGLRPRGGAAARRGVWAPYYTIHKIMAGLLDVHQLCGNQQALDVGTKMADWAKYRVDHITEAQQQAALGTEHGGMNEVLANIYAATGNPEYLRV